MECSLCILTYQFQHLTSGDFFLISSSLSQLKQKSWRKSYKLKWLDSWKRPRTVIDIFLSVWPCRSLISSVVLYKFPNIILLLKIDNIYENDYRLSFTTSHPFVFLVLSRPRQMEIPLNLWTIHHIYEASRGKSSVKTWVKHRLPRVKWLLHRNRFSLLRLPFSVFLLITCVVRFC